MNILELKNLNLSFKLEEGIFKTLDDVSLSLKSGKIHALVGESGCGKSMTAMSIIDLLPKNAVINSREMIYKGKVLLDNEIKALRGRKIAFIPQDPMTSLNPLYTIGNQIAEVINFDKTLSKSEIKDKVVDVLSLVKIPNPKLSINLYPHELSGGMKQRVIIAMALAVDAEIIIADEPTTALDVTIQAQIMNLLSNLKKEFNVSILLISHDLGLIGQYADEISVMYSGRIVEQSSVKEFFEDTKHPYSKALLMALPSNSNNNKLITIQGQPPSIQEQIRGCKFYPRCKYSINDCQKEVPLFEEYKKGHFVACYRI
jgi:oligopeptide/dipeptide ABC transporter ATP-binding protein